MRCSITSHTLQSCKIPLAPSPFVLHVLASQTARRARIRSHRLSFEKSHICRTALRVALLNLTSSASPSEAVRLLILVKNISKPLLLDAQKKKIYILTKLYSLLSHPSYKKSHSFPHRPSLPRQPPSPLLCDNSYKTPVILAQSYTSRESGTSRWINLVQRSCGILQM